MKSNHPAPQDEVVNVKLPRFRIEATRSLDPALRGLGVAAAYTPGVADFTNMVRRNLVNLSMFRHRWGEVRGEGTNKHLTSKSLYFFCGLLAHLSAS